MAQTPFSDTLTKTGLLQEVEAKVFGDEGYGRITGDSNLLAQFTMRANRALDKMIYLAMSSDGRWQVDDRNYTDVSIASTTIYSGQRSYTLASEHLVIEKVMITDSQGNRHVIEPMDEQDLDEVWYLQNAPSRTGTPTRYDKRGDQLILDYTPNYEYANALTIYYTRGASYYASTDTTKTMGFPSIFDGYQANHMAAGYAIDRSLSEAGSWYASLQRQEGEIIKFFSGRGKDDRPRIRPAYQNNK